MPWANDCAQKVEANYIIQSSCQCHHEVLVVNMFAAVSSSVAGRTTTEVIEQARIVPVCRTRQRRIGKNHGIGEGELDVIGRTRNQSRGTWNCGAAECTDNRNSAVLNIEDVEQAEVSSTILS